MEKWLRVAAILILAVTIVLSCTVMGTRFTDPSTYAHVINALDQNRVQLLKLSAESAGASAVISALPSDMCSSLADQLAQFTTYFLAIFSVIFLEKYLLTIFGFASCYFLIPVGCGALLINFFFPARFLRSIGPKFIALGVALLLVIPTGVWVNDQIKAVYNKSIDLAIQSAADVSDNLTGVLSDEAGEDTSVIDEAKTMLEEIPGSVAGVIGKFKGVLNRFIEAAAIMIVTNCLVPIAVILLFGWLIKTLFTVQIVLPENSAKPFKFHPREHFEIESRNISEIESDSHSS